MNVIDRTSINRLYLSQSIINEFTWVVGFILGRKSLFWNQAVTQRLNFCSLYPNLLYSYLLANRAFHTLPAWRENIARPGGLARNGFCDTHATRRNSAFSLFPNRHLNIVCVSCVTRVYFFSCNSWGRNTNTRPCPAFHLGLCVTHTISPYCSAWSLARPRKIMVHANLLDARLWREHIFRLLQPLLVTCIYRECREGSLCSNPCLTPKTFLLATISLRDNSKLFKAHVMILNLTANKRSVI